MIAKLLVAYDGSQQAEKAFQLGLEIASKFSAQVIVLSVAQIPEPPMAIEKEDVLESTQKFYKPLFKKLEDMAASSGVKPKFELRVGHTADEIVNAAKEESVDMIVMGHLGGNIIQRWLLGSVAKRVLSYAHCSVVIAR